MDVDLVPPLGGSPPEGIFRRHSDGLAIVRQSTVRQVERHQRSLRLQHVLIARFQFGWARETIVVVDDDLGCSGVTIEGRLGFQRLRAEVGLQPRAGFGRGDVAPGPTVPGLAPAFGDLRFCSLRHADRRRRWG